VLRLRKNFGDKRNGCCITFHHGIFFTKNNITVIPNPPFLSLFLRLKIKLKGRHFDTTEVTEAELLAALNTLTEHDFQDEFKNGRRTGNGAYAWKGTTLRVMAASKPKVACDQMEATVSEIMGGLLYNIIYGLLAFPR
jgi:hypothetical protein